jgi:hypothetical protein
MIVKELKIQIHLIQFQILVLIQDVWTCTPIALNGVKFAKDYQKDSYNKRIIEKNIDDNNILATPEKTLIIFKMWNFKTLKIQRFFQNSFKISKLPESFTMYKWIIMYMMH